MEEAAVIEALSALAHPRRLTVFRLLVQACPDGLAAGAIARALETPANTMSAQLAILARAGLIRSRRDRRSIIYSADYSRFPGLRRAQLLGGVLGVYAAHAMFAEPILQVSVKLRDGPAQALSEFIATFGLLATILGAVRFRPDFTPIAVGLYITSAYWFTASTSFANPAVTIARTLTNTFAGIAPVSAPAFIVAQLAGAIAAVVIFGWLLREECPA